MVLDSYTAWKVTKRPIYSRMPSEQVGISYQDYQATDWLLSFWDLIFIESVDKCEDLVRQFDPELCDSEYLDFLAPICGWTSPYWDTNYPEDSKRILLKNSYSLIWNYKGSKEVLTFVLTALHIDHQIINPGSFILGESQVSVNELGSTDLEFEIVLPIIYPVDGKEWKLTEKIAYLFVPCWVKYDIRH